MTLCTEKLYAKGRDIKNASPFKIFPPLSSLPDLVEVYLLEGIRSLSAMRRSIHDRVEK